MVPSMLWNCLLGMLSTNTGGSLGKLVYLSISCISMMASALILLYLLLTHLEVVDARFSYIFKLLCHVVVI